MYEDFPENELEFDRRFNKEQACLDYLFQLRWPDGFDCPRCGHTEAWKSTQGPLLVSAMWSPAIGDGWDNLSCDEKTADSLV